MTGKERNTQIAKPANNLAPILQYPKITNQPPSAVLPLTKARYINFRIICSGVQYLSTALLVTELFWYALKSIPQTKSCISSAA